MPTAATTRCRCSRRSLRSGSARIAAISRSRSNTDPIGTLSLRRKRAIGAGHVLRALHVVELPVFVILHQDASLRLLESLAGGDGARHGVTQVLAIAEVRADIGLLAKRTVAADEVLEIHALDGLDQRDL